VSTIYERRCAINFAFKVFELWDGFLCSDSSHLVVEAWSLENLPEQNLIGQAC
jgi:hypothetical protein